MNNADDVIAHQLRCSWFSSVQELADFELQRRAWLDKTNSNPHWSYIEFVCSYPDEKQLTDAQLKGWLTKTEYDALSELKLSIEAYSAPKGDNYDNAAVLSDPAWLVVVQAARRIQQHLLAIMTDSDERTALRPLT
jgi:hypothetical protein